jgi:hypothetical protein
MWPKPNTHVTKGHKGNELSDLSHERVLLSYLSFSGVRGAPEETLCGLDTRLWHAKLKENYQFSLSQDLALTPSEDGA